MSAGKCVLCGHALGRTNQTGICAVCRLGGNDPLPLPLSAREQQILQLLADGNTADSVAVKLEPPTSEQSIKERLKCIRRKLDATNTCEAVAKGMRRGLLT